MVQRKLCIIISITINKKTNNKTEIKKYEC